MVIYNFVNKEKIFKCVLKIARCIGGFYPRGDDLFCRMSQGVQKTKLRKL